MTAGVVFPLPDRMDEAALEALLAHAFEGHGAEVVELPAGQRAFARVGGRWTAVTDRPLTGGETEMATAVAHGADGPFLARRDGRADGSLRVGGLRLAAMATPGVDGLCVELRRATA